MKFITGTKVVALACLMLFAASCKETVTNKPAPTVSLTPASASNTPGAVVTTSVQVDAPEGGVLLDVLVNGAASTALPNVNLDGTASQTVDIEFTIPAAATAGTIYTITFQATDKKNQFSELAAFVVTVSAIPPKEIVEVTGSILTNTTWTKDKIYRLNGFVRVGSDVLTSGTPVVGTTATLTIEAGTVIYGKTGTPGGTLIIQRGSQLIANGTANAPIVFTSEKPVGQKKSGDWGGVVLCGRADINATGAGFTSHVNELEGGYGGYYGGGNPGFNNADNSGSLQYVRIEYAGYPINPNQELNGLTFGGVGSGTTVKFIQVTYSNDDSFEWFGGAVNASNLIAYKGIDDDFDTDNGYSGSVQFGLGIRDALIADQSGSNGFESDNDGSGSSNTPITSAVFSNMTIIGPKQTSALTIGTQFQNGAHLRRNTQLKVINSFITGYPTGVFIDGTLGGALTNAANGTLLLNKNILAGVTNWGGNGFGTTANTDEQTVSGLPYTPNSNAAAPPRGRIIATGTIASGSNPFQNGVFTIVDAQINSQNALPWFASSNTILKSYTDAGINSNVFDPLSGAPTFIPTASSPLLTVSPDFTGVSTGALNTTITYRGAFGATDWTLTWTNWNPQITDYSF